MTQPRSQTFWSRAFRSFRRHRSGMFGFAVVVLFILVAIFAPWLAPLDPYLQNSELKFLPPFWLEGGQWPHLFGTDVLGRDLFSRLIYGTRVSLLIGIISVTVGASVGVPLGLLSGYVGNRTDQIIMRLVDFMLAFPSVLLAICIVAVLGPSLQNAMIAIGIVAIPTYARMVRASVLSEKEREYVTADVAMGRRHIAIIFKGILPNILSPVLVVVTLSFASAILEAAALSFIGLGAEPPTPEWGALLLEGKEYLYQAWWLILMPGLCILGTVLGFNLFGDGLRDTFDPRSLTR